MKRAIPVVVLTMLTIGCGGDSDDTTPATDTAQTDTATADTATTDTAVADTTTPPADTTTPDVTLPPPSDVTLPAPDTAVNDTATTGDTATQPATSCRSALECAFGCKDDDCKTACTDGADESIVTGVGNVMTCQTDECSSANDVPCVLSKCYETFSTCYFGGTSGDEETGADCKDTKNCVEETCTDEACVDACLQSATAQAQKDYVTLYFCVKDFCNSNPNLSAEDCKKQGELSVCSSQWQFCFDF